MGRRVDRHLAPQMRGRLTPRILDALLADGWHVHQIGQAVYVHGGHHQHLIFGVWPRRTPPPTWGDRLGRVSAAYTRRQERRTIEQRWRRETRDQVGRFSGLLPWWRWPQPGAYGFEPLAPGWHDQELADAAEHNAEIRADLWYGETSPTISRSMDGDR